MEKRLLKMFHAFTLLFLLLWGPGAVASDLWVLVWPGTNPQAYLTVSLWLKSAQDQHQPCCVLLLQQVPFHLARTDVLLPLCTPSPQA